MDLVTLQDARNHIRTDSDADDAWFAVWIPAISQAVMSWLKEDWRAFEPILDENGNPLLDSNGDAIPFEDSDGDRTVKPMVRAACLIELAQQYRFRDGAGAAAVPSEWGHGYVLGAGATSLLVSVRKSTVR